MQSEHDYVIVGGGSSGCVVAGMLADDPRVRVLVLERGQAADENPETLRADGYKDAFANDNVIWDRFSAPQRGCGGKRLFVGTGTGLGGSGSVNAMVYLRGSREDFDSWDVDGWRWNDVVPHFEALERTLKVHRREPTTFTETCIRAAEQVGFSRARDFHDGHYQGVLGYGWMNYDGDQRRSSYVAFVRPLERGNNLTIKTRARARRITYDERGRANGVEFEDHHGIHWAKARREVVLCAGALETPKLLMLSGIGPGFELRRWGVANRAELDGVGRNLQDHPNVTLFFKGKSVVDCNYPQLYGFHRANPESPLPETQADTCYVFYPGRSSLREALIRMLPAVTLPVPLYQRPPVRNAVRAGVKLAFQSQSVRRFVEHVYGIVVILGKPLSRGSVRLGSTRPDDEATVDPGYFTHETDMQTMVRGIRLARRIAATQALRGWGNRELFPSTFVSHERAIEAFVRGNAMTTYHFGGTCRMGTDARSVVDERLRVRGVPGLRVADAAALPVVPVSALNAPSMLMGLRAAQFLREEAPL